MTIAPGGAASPEPGSQAIRYHDTLAESWTERYASGGFKRRADFFTTEVLPKKAAISGDWIDVGCGSGVFSRMLAAAGANVLGVDGSAAMIAAAFEEVDCTPMEGFDPPALDKLLGLDSRGLRSVALLPLGYRDTEGDWLVKLPKVRRPLERFVTEV